MHRRLGFNSKPDDQDISTTIEYTMYITFVQCHVSRVERKTKHIGLINILDFWFTNVSRLF